MKIRTHNTIENGKYRVTKTTEDFSEVDTEGMEEFGEPEIDLGGTFGTDPEFTLSANLEKVKTGSPFTHRFDARDYDLHQVTLIAVAGGGDAPTLGGKYFDLTTVSNTYRVWFDENNTNAAPADGGRTLVEVDLPLAGNVTDTAAALILALDNLADVTSVAGTAALDVLATDAGYGPVTDAVHGDTTSAELVISTPVQGDSAQYRAEAWDTEISVRITAAIIGLRQLMDTFSGEEVENV